MSTLTSWSDEIGTRLDSMVALRRDVHRLTMGCPPVVNPDRDTDLVYRCAVDELGEAAVTEGPPVMASDDMSLFLRARPGGYVRGGIAPAHGRPAPHHAPEFEINELGLPIGLCVALGVMRSRPGA